MPKYTEDQMRHAFEAFDTDHNGYMDIKEIRNLVMNRLKLSGPLAENVCRCILEAHDLNKDSKLSYAEFKKGVGCLCQLLEATSRKALEQYAPLFIMKSGTGCNLPGQVATSGLETVLLLSARNKGRD